jgi:hypothetical protein
LAVDWPLAPSNGAGIKWLGSNPGLRQLACQVVKILEHGVLVQHIPWSEGKRLLTTTMIVFLARWARRLSWRETAQIFPV